MVAGTELKITPDGVFITTTGIFKVKANEHVLDEGGQVDVNIPNLPVVQIGNFGEGFRLFEETTKTLIPNHTLWVKRESGEIQQIDTDEKGETKQIKADHAEKIKVLISPQTDIFIG